MSVDLKVKDILIEARRLLKIAHTNWSDLAHDATSTCKFCQLVRKIEDLLVSELSGMPEDITSAQKARGTYEEVVNYVLSRGLTNNDAAYVFDKWTSNGWKIAGRKIVDWRAAVRAWCAAGHFPSQKPQMVNGRPAPPRGKTYLERELNRIEKNVKELDK